MRLFIGSFAKLENYRSIKEDFSFIEGKWVEPRNIHLTLLFLGEVKIPESIVFRLQSLCYEKVTLPIKGLGFFGSPAKVLYAKVADEGLTALHERICQMLDFEPNKPYLPHITLCRIKRIKNYDRFLKKIGEYENKKIGQLTLEVALIKSELTKRGPIYTPLATF